MTEYVGFTTGREEAAMDLPRPQYPDCYFTQQCAPAAHVAAGAAWLDQVASGWEGRVDLGLLDIEDPSLCICGQVITPQVFGKDHSAWGGWGLVDQWLGGLGMPNGRMAHLGFTLSEDQDAWVSLLKDRFNTGRLSDG